MSLTVFFSSFLLSHSVIEMLKHIESPDRIPAFLESIKKKDTSNAINSSTMTNNHNNNKYGMKGKKQDRVKLMGFGHRVYKGLDPRAVVCKSLALEVYQSLYEHFSIVLFVQVFLFLFEIELNCAY